MIYFFLLFPSLVWMLYNLGHLVNYYLYDLTITPRPFRYYIVELHNNRKNGVTISGDNIYHYKDGYRHGSSFEELRYGKVYTNYVDGLRQGPSREESSTGTFIGNYLNGKKHGEWKFIYHSGGYRITNMKYNSISGLESYYNKDGILMRTIMYANNVYHGISRFYDTNGSLYQEIEYFNGHVINQIDYHNGVKMREITNDGMVKFTTVLYYKDGSIKSIVSTINDQLEGDKLVYYKGSGPGARLKMKCSYVDGSKHGELVRYDLSGNVITCKKYVHIDSYEI